MASNFTIVGQQRTVIVRSPTHVEDAQELHVVTHPHGVNFVRVLPLSAWHAGGAAKAVGPIAAHIEHIFASHPVVSAGAVQNVTANGLVVNAVEFVVHAGHTKAGDPEAHTATVEISVQELHDKQDFSHHFAPVMAALKAAADA